MNASRGAIAMLIVCHLVINMETSIVSSEGENVDSGQQTNEFLKREPDIHLQRAQSQVMTRRLKMVDEPESPTISADKQSPFAVAAAQQPYKCAKHCTCSSVSLHENTSPLTAAAGLSVIQQPIEQILATRLADSGARFVNLARAKCESAHFTDVLTIDWRTQIIHISLPTDKSRAAGNSSFDYAAMLANKKLPDPLDRIAPMKSNQNANKTYENQFRMPRLARFTLLQEIVIINLKFEVCDSEVFKRGQKLRRLKWNWNQLREISRDCFRHLDKLIDLNLDHNQLRELESALFSSLVSLKHLSMAYNQLSELAAHQFANLSQLQSLNLVGNSFKSINLHLLEPMQNSLRLLVLARNQIKNFVYTTMQTSPLANLATNSSTKLPQLPQLQQQILAGVFFKNLIKLNVDFNRFERIKMLQLHRFYNIKFLSIRANQISSIRDRAFDGRKLVELNLAQNKLQLISRCAFCNSTIKRLILAENNISLPLPVAPSPLAPSSPAVGAQQNAPIAQQLVAGEQVPAAAEATLSPLSPLYLNAASSSSMLVLSQSIFGPLFNQLEYLDLSHNQNLGPQLESLLEPLLELQFLELANVGLDRSLPTPNLFKNLRQLKYLNLSSNGLDQLLSESVEPLLELEMLDLSSNQFNELDESLLIILDELPKLKYVNLGANPWFCSQCKISPLHDWTQRSPIYNATCLSQQAAALLASSLDEVAAPANDPGPKTLDDELESTAEVAAAAAAISAQPDESTLNSGFIYRQSARPRGIQDYLLLNGNGADAAKEKYDVSQANVDFDLIMNLFDGSSMGNTDDSDTLKQLKGPNYEFSANIDGSLDSASHKRQLSDQLLKSLATGEDDESVARTITSLSAASQLHEADKNELVLRKYFMGHEFCLKCEFPSELRAFNLHELTPTDFKHCTGMGPRFAASEPKIGLTLAIVIIGALFCVIVIVIIMYRKKSNTYFPNEELTEQLENGTAGTRNAGQPKLSVSSDLDHEYRGDATDYSSPPMSQSYESYSQDDEEMGEEEEEEEEDEEEEEEEEEDEEEEEEEDEDEEEEEDEELDEEPHEEFDDDDGASRDRDHSYDQTNGHASGTSDTQEGRHAGQHSSSSKRQSDEDHSRHHVTISEVNNRAHHDAATSDHTASNGLSEHISVVPINTSDQHENQQSIASQTPNEASEKKRPAHANKSQSSLNQTPVALEQLDARTLIERQNVNNEKAPSETDWGATAARLSADGLNQQQGTSKSVAENRSEAARKNRQSSKLVHLTNLAGSLHEQQARVRSARSHESPTQQQATRPSALKQSKTTAVADIDSSLANTLPPLPANFRSAGNSPSERAQQPLASQLPVPPSEWQHHHSSGQSTAGSVSFAAHQPRTHQTGHRISDRTVQAAGGRRERLMSQTICVDVEHPPATIKRRIGHTNSVRVAPHQHLESTRRVEDKTVLPLLVGRQTQVESGEISQGEPREAVEKGLRHRLAQTSAMSIGAKHANWNGSASKSSWSSTSVSHHSDQVVAQTSQGPSISRTSRPNLSKAGARQPMDTLNYAEAAEGFDILSPESSPARRLTRSQQEVGSSNPLEPRHQVIGGSRGATRAATSKLVAQHRAIALSPGESPPVARAQPNHRHHIKQLTSDFETSWNGEPHDQGGSLALDQDDSMDLAARFDELPSDLDDSEVEQFLSAGAVAAPVRSSAALELLDDEDREQIQSLDERQEEQNFEGLTVDSGKQLSNSHSTHSALTQTGSRELDYRRTGCD